MRSFAPIASVALLSLACGSSDAVNDDAPGDAATAGGGAPNHVDGASPVDTPDDASSMHVPGAPPIVAAAGTWSYVPIEGARCANGTPTGIAVNPVDDPQGIIVSMQGGGACWDALTCVETQAAINLSVEVGESAVLAEATKLAGGIFDHDDPGNLFARYVYVYVPYCTGDLHAGRRSRDYTNASGTTTIHHQGGTNVERYIERLVASYPDVSRLLLFGISAGGFGATRNWWRYQAAFPAARVDVLNDAGLLIDPADDRFATMVEAWDMALPTGCADCGTRLSAWLPFYGSRLTAPRRHGLLGFLGDAVIGSYFALSAPEMETRLMEVRATAADNQKTFFLSGSQHSVVGEGAAATATDGATLIPWLLAMFNDDPSWDHAGP